MSLIQHAFFPRSAFDMDLWLGPETLLAPTPVGLAPITTLDVFDPFDDLDRMLGRNLMWLEVPNVLRDTISAATQTPPQPRVPHKYRISVGCKNYRPDSIKTELSDDKTKLIVQGREGTPPPTSGESNEDFHLRQFRRTFPLPPNVKTDEMVSFMTKNGHLIIEMPLIEEEKLQQPPQQQQQQLESNKSDLIPRVVSGEGGEKFVEMNMLLPESIVPENVRVTCKDRDIIVQAEHKQSEDVSKSIGHSRMFFYRRMTLPENTDFKDLKCTWDQNQLRIKAPLNVSFESTRDRSIPVEILNNQQQKLTDGGQQPQQKVSDLPITPQGDQQLQQPSLQTPLNTPVEPEQAPIVNPDEPQEQDKQQQTPSLNTAEEPKTTPIVNLEENKEEEEQQQPQQSPVVPQNEQQTAPVPSREEVPKEQEPIQEKSGGISQPENPVIQPKESRGVNEPRQEETSKAQSWESKKQLVEE